MGHIACMKIMRYACKVSFGHSENNGPLGRLYVYGRIILKLISKNKM
jgi:hypothetical protein